MYECGLHGWWLEPHRRGTSVVVARGAKGEVG